MQKACGAVWPQAAPQSDFLGATSRLGGDPRSPWGGKGWGSRGGGVPVEGPLGRPLAHACPRPCLRPRPLLWDWCTSSPVGPVRAAVSSGLSATSSPRTEVSQMDGPSDRP